MAQESTQQNGKKTNLSIDQNGKLYEYSKEPQDGFVEHKSTSGKVSYRKYYRTTDAGKICYLAINKRDYVKGEVEAVVIGIAGEDNTDFITFDMRKGATTNLSDYTKYLARVLGDMDFSQKYTLSPNTKKNEAGYLLRDFFVNPIDDAGEQLPFIKPTLTFSDIPKMEKREAQGKTINDFTKQDDFLYDVLMKQFARFAAYKAANRTSAPDVDTTHAQEADVKPTGKAKAAPVPVEAGDEDLPF